MPSTRVMHFEFLAINAHLSSLTVPAQKTRVKEVTTHHVHLAGALNLQDRDRVGQLLAKWAVSSPHTRLGVGGGSEKSDSVGGFETPPFLKMVYGGVLRVFFFNADTPFLRNFFGGIFLDCTSKTLSFPPFQPLLMLSPHSEIHALLRAPPPPNKIFHF